MSRCSVSARCRQAQPPSGMSGCTGQAGKHPMLDGVTYRARLQAYSHPDPPSMIMQAQIDRALEGQAATLQELEAARVHLVGAPGAPAMPGWLGWQQLHACHHPAATGQDSVHAQQPSCCLSPPPSHHPSPPQSPPITAHSPPHQTQCRSPSRMRRSARRSASWRPPWQPCSAWRRATRRCGWLTYSSCRLVWLQPLRAPLLIRV